MNILKINFVKRVSFFLKLGLSTICGGRFTAALVLGAIALISGIASYKTSAEQADGLLKVFLYTKETKLDVGAYTAVVAEVENTTGHDIVVKASYISEYYNSVAISDELPPPDKLDSELTGYRLKVEVYQEASKHRPFASSRRLPYEQDVPIAPSQSGLMRVELAPEYLEVGRNRIRAILYKDCSPVAISQGMEIVGEGTPFDFSKLRKFKR